MIKFPVHQWTNGANEKTYLSLKKEDITAVIRRGPTRTTIEFGPQRVRNTVLLSFEGVLELLTRKEPKSKNLLAGAPVQVRFGGLK